MQRIDRKQAAVRRNFFACPEDYDVSRHYFFVGDNVFLSLPDYRGVRHHELLQRQKDILGPAFLNRPDQRIKKKHEQNDEAVDMLARGKDDGCRQKKDIDKGALKLLQENKREILPFPMGENVFPMLEQTLFCFVFRKAFRLCL